MPYASCMLFLPTSPTFLFSLLLLQHCAVLNLNTLYIDSIRFRGVSGWVGDLNMLNLLEMCCVMQFICLFLKVSHVESQENTILVCVFYRCTIDECLNLGCAAEKAKKDK